MNDLDLSALRGHFPWDSAPEYFAGGHAWSDGTVFRYAFRGEDRLLKVMRAGTERCLASVRERQSFQEYLNLHGVDTVLPLRSTAGNLAEPFTHDDEDYIVYSWRMVPGDHTVLGDPRGCEPFYRRWGSMLGRMHRLAKEWPDWRNSACADADGQPLISRFWEWNHFYHWFQDDEVREAWVEMKHKLNTLPVNRANHGFLHNDPHPGNILSHGNRLILIDFDVANYQWFMVDLAICVYSEYSRVNFHSPYARRAGELDALFITPFMSAYEEENTLDPDEYARVELFLNYRRFLMFACFYDQIKDNAPAYLQEFKQDIISGKRYLPGDNWFSRAASILNR